MLAVLQRRFGGDEASSLAEFAVSLPLLVVLVVGIFDFGGAFNQKQELNNAVREGARFGAAQPTNDLCAGCAAPPSVDAIRVLVDNYLVAARLNDCGLGGLSQPTGGPTWIYGPVANNGCPSGGLTLTIKRGAPDCVLTANYGAATVNIPCTQVSVSYAYNWHFNSVIQLLVPGAGFTPIPIPTSATAANMD